LGAKQVQMYFKIARTVNLLVVVLMSLEIICASAAASPSTSCYSVTIFSEDPSSSILETILFEKAEEENDNTEEDEIHLSCVVLLDFSRLTLSLSAFHSPDFHSAVSRLRYDVRLPLHQLNSVFLI
jgi:hypothetical protein